MESTQNAANSLDYLSSRRSLISQGGALLGACLLGSTATTSYGQSAPSGPDTPRSTFNVKEFGATGVRKDNATKPFKDAIEACASAGGGRVDVPPGEYTVGTVKLLDHVTLNIEGGATLFLSQDRNDFIPGRRTMI